jgi:hypothetical protein
VGLAGKLRTLIAGNAELATAGAECCGVFGQALPVLGRAVVVSGLMAVFVSPERQATPVGRVSLGRGSSRVVILAFVVPPALELRQWVLGAVTLSPNGLRQLLAPMKEVKPD